MSYPLFKFNVDWSSRNHDVHWPELIHFSFSWALVFSSRKNLIRSIALPHQLVKWLSQIYAYVPAIFRASVMSERKAVMKDSAKALQSSVPSSTRKTYVLWKTFICRVEQRHGNRRTWRYGLWKTSPYCMIIAERYKVLEDENVWHEGIKLLQEPRTCETCRNFVIPDMMAIFTYRDHAVVLQALCLRKQVLLRLHSKYWWDGFKTERASRPGPSMLGEAITGRSRLVADSSLLRFTHDCVSWRKTRL